MLPVIKYLVAFLILFVTLRPSSIAAIIVEKLSSTSVISEIDLKRFIENELEPFFKTDCCKL